jgi:hypothetical protein
MDTEQPSAQAAEGQDQAPQGGGLQARIDELVAKQRQAEEGQKEAQRQLMETTAVMAQMAAQSQRQVAPAPVHVDPLAQFKDQLDPVAHAAIQAAVAETRRQMQAEFQPVFAQQAAQLAGFAVRSEAAAIVGLPREVTDRAAMLAASWRAQGLPFPPGDAINFALGEYQRGQLSRAAPVIGYDPRAALAQPNVSGFTPPPPAPRGPALPSNFDNLSRAQQNAALEQSGALDETF